ncbi:MAG: magnesium/cobalt transporter CorA [Chloroflexota bacterium]
MKTTLMYVRERNVILSEDQASIEEALAAGLRQFWLDVESPGPEGVDWLARRFKFHPLALEDLLQPTYRPKLEEYEDSLFLVAHSAGVATGQDTSGEVQSFLGRDFLVTVHDGPSPCIARVQRLVQGDVRDLLRGSDYVLYLIINEMAISYFNLVDSLDDEIDQLETEVLRSTDGRILDRILDMRRTLGAVRRISSYQRDALNSLAAYQGSYIRRSNAVYVHDVHNLMVTVHEMVDSQRELTSGILDAHLSTMSNRLNNVVKRLTIVATIFLPISFVASLFGVNFIRFMPFDNAVAFWLFITTLILAPAAMLVWFWRLGWF